MFITYVLQSLQDYSYYIGYTSNLPHRLIFHNSGKTIYTRRKIPWNVVFQKEFTSKLEAIRYEKYLKSLKGGIKFYEVTGLPRKR